MSGKVLACLIFLVSIGGCASDEPPSRERLGECAQAMSLEAEAYERLERIRNGTSSDLADYLASRSFTAAAQYRAAACLPFPPNEFGEVLEWTTEDEKLLGELKRKRDTPASKWTTEDQKGLDELLQKRDAPN